MKLLSVTEAKHILKNAPNIDKLNLDMEFMLEELHHSGGQDTGRAYMLLYIDDEPSYTAFDTRDDALKWLAACISEGSANLYGGAYLFNSYTYDIELIEELTYQGFKTRSI